MYNLAFKLPKEITSVSGELHSHIRPNGAYLGVEAGKGVRPKNKFDLIFGNSGFASYDVWVSRTGTVSFSIELKSSKVNTGDFLYVFIGDNLHNFQTEK
eukprot:Awhi_evm1s6749